jgi:hypothetical protein
MLDPFLTYMHMQMIGSLGNPGSWDLVCVGRLVVPHPCSPCRKGSRSTVTWLVILTPATLQALIARIAGESS